MENANEQGFIDGEADAQVDDRQQLLHRLEQNDPTLVSIEVGDDWEMDTQYMPYGDGLVQNWSGSGLAQCWGEIRT
jgi:hypothetical protein